MDKNKYFNLKNKVIFFLSFCILLILVLVSVLPNSFASLVPVKSISFESEKLSYEKNEAGSYKITKSAEWIAKGKARITFQVDTKELKKENTKADTILIVDTSASMSGEKLDKVKSDSIDLIQKALQDNNNRIGIIEFNDTASIVSNLSNDISDLTNKINSLTTSGNTNYYQALVKLDEILQNYQKEENRELTVLFLTDGLPNRNTPNEEGQYKYLKSEYPYLNTNAIQYEMGSTVLEAIKNISDNQFIADMDTLNNVLIDAAVPRQIYNNFKITDYINTEYFTIEDKEDIKTSIGKVSLDNEKVIWNLEELSSGKSVTMTIDVYLKEEYIDKFDLYKTNTKEEVTSEIDGIKENISKTDTPILSNSFTVSYDENTPAGCNVEGTLPESKQYSVFNPVKIEETTITCEGYEFQGWEVANKDDVSMIGNSYFISDGNDIKLRAIWSKVSLNKSMDGKVNEIKSKLKSLNFDDETWEIYQGEFWNDAYKLNTTKVIIQNKLSPIEGAVEFWDVSEATDGSVMAYAVLNEDQSTYTIYLQGSRKIIAPENSAYLFGGFDVLESIEGLEYLDTSQVTDMSYMFSYCSNLTSLNLSNFDTSSVINMNDMFSNCFNLTELDVSGFDTSNVTDMSSMFYFCFNLKTLNLKNFNTSKVENMNSMFYHCENITNLDLSSFNTSNVTDMDWMFSNCSSLIDIDLSSFDTSNVISMYRMFGSCSSLTTLDLSSFDTSKVLSIQLMFSKCSNLKLIDFRNATFINAVQYFDMFMNTSNLSVIVKDEANRSWIQSRLGSNGTAIIAS